MSARRFELGAAFLVGSIVLSAAGQLAMKVGMAELHTLIDSVSELGWSAELLVAPPTLWTAAGLASYGASMLCWLVVLARYPLSFAYPMLGLSYVLVYLGATEWPRLAETASASRSLGTLLIVIGVALVSMSGRARRAPLDGDHRGA
jgi:undecaprenyl phosphate-alpha-L-ara4N flippase subunit ArnF